MHICACNYLYFTFQFNTYVSLRILFCRIEFMSTEFVIFDGSWQFWKFHISSLVDLYTIYAPILSINHWNQLRNYLCIWVCIVYNINLLFLISNIFSIICWKMYEICGSTKGKISLSSFPCSTGKNALIPAGNSNQCL